MHYVVADGRIFCGAVNFSPDSPHTWHCGEIVSFSTAIYHIAPAFRFASLLSAGGDGWGIEVDVRSVRQKEDGLRIRCAVQHRISGNQHTQGAVVRLCQRLFESVVPLDAAHYLPEELDRIIALVLRESGRPVINYGQGGRMEASLSKSGKVRWRRHAG